MRHYGSVGGFAALGGTVLFVLAGFPTAFGAAVRAGQFR